MGSLRRFNLRLIRTLAGIGVLVETGTGKGDSASWALRCGFDPIHCTEIEPALHQYCCDRFAGCSNVHLQVGESVTFLKTTLPSISQPKLIYLDAHFVGGADFGITSYQQSIGAADSFPLLDEVKALDGQLGSNDILIVDDARMYLSGEFQAGECPAFARQWDRMAELEAIFDRWSGTHVMVVLQSDHGYFLLLPKSLEDRAGEFMNLLPQDGELQQFRVSEGVGGVTSISLLRRVHDARFATRYLVGAGIDVGGGSDSLALCREFFPRISSLLMYDRACGDGQDLANVPDECCDFLYSSHCLEHLRDPRIALRNWVRVVKPGGFLVIQVPDEDLYEQGNWPSKFNGDHKLTFTIGKTRSWSPVSFNVIDLVRELLADVEPLSIALLDHGYRYGLQESGLDQTRTPMAEAGIEMILAKRHPA